ncbi:uncharacterized protein TNCV_4476251 [Trichonephila clavipes]|nr:uncharacterized protein TNCV_4476251 [Trichonephila clavipes]
MEPKSNSFTSKEQHVVREPQVADPCLRRFLNYVKTFKFLAVREHVDCITKATDEADCSSGEGGINLQDKTRDEEECKNLIKGGMCLYIKITSECNRNAAVTYIRMYHPLVRLLRSICYARGLLQN